MLELQFVIVYSYMLNNSSCSLLAPAQAEVWDVVGTDRLYIVN